MLVAPANGLPLMLVSTSGNAVQPPRLRRRSRVPLLVIVALPALSARTPLPGVVNRKSPLRGIVTTQSLLGPGVAAYVGVPWLPSR